MLYSYCTRMYFEEKGKYLNLIRAQKFLLKPESYLNGKQITASWEGWKGSFKRNLRIVEIQL